MKNLVTRFGMLAVLGMLVGGLMVAGCGGAPEDDGGAANNAAAPAAGADAGDGS